MPFNISTACNTPLLIASIAFRLSRSDSMFRPVLVVVPKADALPSEGSAKIFAVQMMFWRGGKRIARARRRMPAWPS